MFVVLPFFCQIFRVTGDVPTPPPPTSTVNFLSVGADMVILRHRVVVNFPNVVDLTFPRQCCFYVLFFFNSPTVRCLTEKIRHVTFFVAAKSSNASTRKCHFREKFYCLLVCKDLFRRNSITRIRTVNLYPT